MEESRRRKYSYFILRRWRMPIEKYIMLLALILVIALFVERFCFAVVVYKTKNYGMVLIVLIMFFNSIFLYVI